MIYAVALAISTHIAFEVVGNSYSVGWSISVHFVDNLSFSAVLMHIAAIMNTPLMLPKLLDNNRRLIKYLSNTFGVFYAMHAFIELTWVGSSFNAYREGGISNGLFAEGLVVSHLFASVIGVCVYVFIMNLKQRHKKFLWA